MKKLITLLPAANEDTASSRIRVFSFARELKKKGIPFTYSKVINPSVVIIQKRVTHEIFKYAQKVKRRGAIIVYDIDDLGPALDYWVNRDLLLKMLQLADVIVTATQEQGKQVQDIFPVKTLVAIENCIDYYPTGPIPPKVLPAAPLRILWFGNSCNLKLFEKYSDCILAIPNVEVVICANSSAEKFVTQTWPFFEFIPWDLTTFVSTLRSCHLTCLMHDGSKEDRAKANNRMITSICWGVPAIVSNTPSYVRTAKEAGVEDFVFETPDDMLAIIEKLRTDKARKQYLNIAQKHIWKRYSPESIAEEYLSVINSIISQVQGLRKILRLWN